MQLKVQISWISLRTVGLFLLHLTLAFIGTAVLETAGRRLVAPLLEQVHSPQSAIFARLGEEWFFSLGCAALIGFIFGNHWPDDKSARWIWTVPTALLLTRVLLVAMTSRQSSVLDQGVDTVWSRFSGLGCYSWNGRLSCVDFFVFTLSTVRSVAYSVAARFRWLHDSRVKSTITAAE
jgi:hypothetical protein